MRSLIGVLILLSSFCLCINKGNAQNKPSANEIIQRAIAAFGGVEAINEIKNVHLVYQFQYDGNIIFLHQYKSFPGKYFQWIGISEDDPQTEKYIYNNGEAVNIYNGVSIKITDPIDIENLRLESIFIKEMGYSNEKYPVFYVSKCVYTQHAYLLFFKKPYIGLSFDKSYSKETGLPTHYTTKGMEIFYYDYANFQKVLVPRHLKIIYKKEKIYQDWLLIKAEPISEEDMKVFNIE